MGHSFLPWLPELSFQRLRELMHFHCDCHSFLGFFFFFFLETFKNSLSFFSTLCSFITLLLDLNFLKYIWLLPRLNFFRVPIFCAALRLLTCFYFVDFSLGLYLVSSSIHLLNICISFLTLLSSGIDPWFPFRFTCSCFIL